MNSRELSPNVYGIETEYSLMVRFPDNVVHEIVGECHSIDASLGLYQTPSEGGGRNLKEHNIRKALREMGITMAVSGMLSNGGRFYLDPSGPEYATPEAATAEEAVHLTFVGDSILIGALRYLMSEEVIKGYQVNRRIVDHNRVSRGVHLNTCTKIADDNSPLEVYDRLATLNVAKGAMFGSGGLLLNAAGETEFHHSPRLSVTNQLVAKYSNYTRRPLVRAGFKPEGKELYRIETVTADALSFAWPLRASLVMTNALTKLIEMRRHKTLPVIVNPVKAALEVGKDGNALTVPIVNKQDDALQVYPSEILRTIAEEALIVDGEEGHLDDESRQVLSEVIEVADKLEKDPMSAAKQVESIARLNAFRRKMEKSHVELSSEKMCRYDYLWDRLEDGLAVRLKETGVGWHGFDSTRSLHPTKKDLKTPPANTRAVLRGATIAAEGMHNKSSWSKLHDREGNEIFVDPLETDLPEWFK